MYSDLDHTEGANIAGAAVAPSVLYTDVNEKPSKQKKQPYANDDAIANLINKRATDDKVRLFACCQAPSA